MDFLSHQDKTPLSIELYTSVSDPEDFENQSHFGNSSNQTESVLSLPHRASSTPQEAHIPRQLVERSFIFLFGILILCTTVYMWRNQLSMTYTQDYSPNISVYHTQTIMDYLWIPLVIMKSFYWLYASLPYFQFGLSGLLSSLF